MWPWGPGLRKLQGRVSLLVLVRGGKLDSKLAKIVELSLKRGKLSGPSLCTLAVSMAIVKQLAVLICSENQSKIRGFAI
jgi:hypothetical protein